MSDRYARPDWLGPQPGLTAFALVSSLLAVAVLVPYLQFVLFGVVLAYIMFPIQRLLRRLLGRTISALVLVVGTILLVLLPLIYVVSIALRQAFGVVTSIREGDLNVARVEELIESIGYEVDLVVMYEANQERIAAAIREVAIGVLDIAGTLPGMFIGLTITVFVLFTLLRDGDRLVSWFQWILPIEDQILDELREGLNDLMWASVIGNVAVALIQAIMLGVGLQVAGLPAVVFLSVTTFVLTLLPLIGAFGVWLPAAAYLAVSGQQTMAAGLAVYGLFVTFSDTYLRPALIGQTAAFNAATVVVGIFGGLVVFGTVGLFIGPVVLGGAKLSLDCFAKASEEKPAAGTVQASLDSSTEEPADEDGPEPTEPDSGSADVSTQSNPSEAADDESDE